MGKTQQTISSSLKEPPTMPQLPDLICLSHLRWDSIYQRPHHVMRRFAKERRIFFIEEPVFANGHRRLKIRVSEPNIWVVTPHLSLGTAAENVTSSLAQMIDDLTAVYTIRSPILWYYTPLALAFTHHLQPLVVVYDCMNELSLFKGEASAINEWEAQLFERADLVFNGRTLSPEPRHVHLPHMQLFPHSPETGQLAEAHFVTNQAGLVGSYDHSPVTTESW
jgi:UDP-galactopyranose mutase